MTQIVREQCISLWNSDLLTMPRHPLFSRAFLFRACKVKEVAVFGVVTSVELIKSVRCYCIDDGTGVMLCALDESCAAVHEKDVIHLLDFHRDPLNIFLHSNTTLTSMLERSVEVLSRKNNFEEGDSVYIVGKISEYAEELRVVTISFICPLEDFKTEILLMEIRSQFYKKILNIKDTDARKKKQTISKSISDNCSDSENESDKDSEGNLSEIFTNKAGSSYYKTMGYCVGEWQEEYFTYNPGLFSKFDEEGENLN